MRGPGSDLLSSVWLGRDLQTDNVMRYDMSVDFSFVFSKEVCDNPLVKRTLS